MELKNQTQSGSIYQGEAEDFFLSPAAAQSRLVIFTDPPYGHGKKIVASPGGKWRHLKPNHKKVTWNEKPPAGIFKYIKKDLYLCFGGNYFPELWGGLKEIPTPANAKELRTFIDTNKRNWIIWDKIRSEKLSFSRYELINSNMYEPTQVYRCLWNGLAKEEGDTRKRPPTIHPCQKPIELLTRIITENIPQGSVIADPYAGSCSLAVAIERLNRNVKATGQKGWRYICIEKDEDYLTAALEWVQEETARRTLWKT